MDKLAVEVMGFNGVLASVFAGFVATTGGGIMLVLSGAVGVEEGTLVLGETPYKVVEPTVLTSVLSSVTGAEAMIALVAVTMESCSPILLVTSFCREVKVLYSTNVEVERKVERDVLNASDTADAVEVERIGWVAIGTDDAALAAAMQPAR